MKIISNNCLGGYTYREILNTEYKTPFIWNRILNDEFLYLLENFEKINFSNYELKKKNQGLKIKNGFYIQVDDKINLYFNHNWFSENDNTPRIDNNQVFYNKIWEYTIEKYEKRLNRMLDDKDAPVVIVEDDLNFKDLPKLIDICKKKDYKLILITNKIAKTFSEKLLVLPMNLNTDEPLNYIKEYKNEIKTFLSHS